MATTDGYSEYDEWLINKMIERYEVKQNASMWQRIKNMVTR